MSDEPFKVHFEVFAKRNAKAGFVLELATEDRERALESAEELLTVGRVLAVKVTKETMDETNAFHSVTIFSKGDDSRPAGKAFVDDGGPACASPQDLYTPHARERIARLLEAWLQRNRCTPFELLHRADLMERLEAAGVDLKHAMQKISVPEAQERGVSVHEVLRRYQKLAEQTIERVLKHRRRGAFPDLEKEGFAAAARRLVDEPERHFLLSGGVAASLSAANGWTRKIELLLDLADAAPTDPKARVLAFQVLEQPLIEILGARAGLAELLGPELDLGGSLAAMSRMATPLVVDALAASDARIRDLTPALGGAALRLSAWLGSPQFKAVQAAITRRVLSELNSPRRLRPDSAVGEIEIMRVLAMLLTAAAGTAGVIQHDDVRDAFAYRSESLLSANFIGDYLADTATAIDELHALVRLAENVTGAANKRKAAQVLGSSIGGVRLERELRESAESPTVKLASLAEVQRAIRRAGLQDGEDARLCAKLGEAAGPVEADSKLIATIVRSNSTTVQKLAILLRYAAGEAGPSGPVAGRARAELLKLLKAPQARAELAGSPEALTRLKPLFQAVGLAA